MDPQFEALVTTLREKFDAQKAAQAAVVPLQSAADLADAALNDGKVAVVTSTAETETALKALEDYIEGTPTPPPTLPGGGGDNPPAATGRRMGGAQRG